jgi:ABC-type transport system involved in multi-copper enzyme maturation permease subunit
MTINLRLWRRVIPAILLVAGGGVLLAISGQLPPVVEGLFWASFLLFFAYVSRPLWHWLFSPVLRFDLVRTTRRSNFAAMRAVYACSLLAALFVVYLNWVQSSRNNLWDNLWTPGRVPLPLIADFTERFFQVFACIQLGAVLVIAPICAAPALAEEKERRTFEFLLATQLDNAEIIVGKLVSRLSYLALLVLTGLPILGLVQFLGGLDPRVVLSAFAITAATLCSVTCLSVACSVTANTSRGAILYTYACTAGFVIFSACCTANPVLWISAGNPIGAFLRLFVAIPNSGGNEYLPLVLEYTFVHSVYAMFLLVAAVRNVRLQTSKEEWTRRQATPVEPVAIYEYRPRPHWEAALWFRPTVRDRPILWKELYAEPVLHLDGAGGVAAIIATGLFLPIGYTILMGFSLAVSTQGVVSRATHPLAAYGGSLVGCVLLVGIALKAGSSISRERMHRTWDNLLTSTLDNQTILFEKWLGSILAVRNGWWVLGCIWGLGLVTGGLHPVALVLLVVVWLILACLVAAIGLLCSVAAKTGLQASLGALLCAVVAVMAPWTVWGIVSAAVSPAYISDELWWWLHDLAWYGMTPPVTLNRLAFPLYLGYPPSQAAMSTTAGAFGVYWPIVGQVIVGSTYYALLAFGVWKLLLARFGPLTGRMPFGENTNSGGE